jgi:hypothetical protein
VKRDVIVERVDDAFVGTFECASCGFETPARVTAWSKGAARGKDDEARATARALALEDAGAIASRTLMFVPCPSCGKHDPKATTYRVQIVLAALAMAVVGFVMLFLVLMKARWDRDLGPWTPVIPAVLGATWGVRTYWKYSRAWTRLDERVTLGGAADPAAPSMRPL